MSAAVAAIDPPSPQDAVHVLYAEELSATENAYRPSLDELFADMIDLEDRTEAREAAAQRVIVTSGYGQRFYPRAIKDAVIRRRLLTMLEQTRDVQDEFAAMLRRLKNRGRS